MRNDPRFGRQGGQARDEPAANPLESSIVCLTAVRSRSIAASAAPPLRRLVGGALCSRERRSRFPVTAPVPRPAWKCSGLACADRARPVPVQMSSSGRIGSRRSFASAIGYDLYPGLPEARALDAGHELESPGRASNRHPLTWRPASGLSAVRIRLPYLHVTDTSLESEGSPRPIGESNDSSRSCVHISAFSSVEWPLRTGATRCEHRFTPTSTCRHTVS